jgi:hypothetical protein
MKEVLWLSCYGISIHAWNSVFFVELASIFGRLLKIDDPTLLKERLDYSRLSVTTSILKELNVVEVFWIHGKKYPIQINEDLEFGLTDDVCLVEYEDDNKSVHYELACLHDEEPLVETLVKHLRNDWN